MTKKLTVTVSFRPGVWKNPARWAVAHDDCVFERTSLTQVRETLEDHLRDYHDVKEVPEVEWRYAIGGRDVTDERASVLDKRVVYEEAERQYKLSRLEFALMMREQGATVDSIGQLLNYQLSTVATWLRDKVHHFQKTEE